MVASTIIGSWDRTMANGGNIGSKLAQKAVKHNLCHSYQAFNTCYADTGLWGCYFVTDKMQIDDFLLNLHNEW
jgi:processing peptidase subunit beta